MEDVVIILQGKILFLNLYTNSNCNRYYDRPHSLFLFRASGNLKGKQDWLITLELAILLRIIIIMASTIAMKMEDKQ